MPTYEIYRDDGTPIRVEGPEGATPAELVRKYLDNEISYISIHKKMLSLLKKPYFINFYSHKPKNINDLRIMVRKVKNYLNENL